MESIARIFVLLLCVALLLALARGGWGGVRQWLRAKFIGSGS